MNRRDIFWIAVGLALVILGIRIARGAEPITIEYVWATWCAPCHKVGPMVEAWAHDRGVHLIKVNYDSEEGRYARTRYHLEGVPQLIRLSDGRIYSPDWIGGFAANYLDAEFLER